MYGGGKVHGTVSLDQAAGPGGLTVTISSNTSVLTMPSSMFIEENRSKKPFEINVGQISVAATRQITVSGGGGTATVNVRIRPGLKSFSVNPTSVTGGDSTLGTITLWGSAEALIPVSVASNSSVIVPPEIVNVQAAQVTADFDISTQQVGADAVRTVTANLGGVIKTAVLQLTRGPRLLNFTINPTSTLGGNNATGTVTLDAAVAGAKKVAISDPSPNASAPSPVVVSSGNFQTFTITTKPVAAFETVVFTAQQGGVTKSAVITLTPPQYLTSLAANPSTVTGGQNSTGTVTLSSAAPVGGKTVTLADNTSALSVPANVVVQAGATTASFQITSTAVTTTVIRQVTATLNGVTKTVNITIKPAP